MRVDAMEMPRGHRPESSWVAGADGFRHRWCVVLLDVASGRTVVRIAPSFADLLTLPEKPAVVAVDIPIGLPDFASPGGRACEREARRVLGRRASSVFSAVGRSALREASRLEAHTASRAAGGLGVGAQAWGLAAKLREADAAMSPDAQAIVHEVHPEVSFWAMNRRTPMAAGKKTARGEADRQAVLVAAGFSRDFVTGMGAPLRVGRDDFLDACAAAWTARRIASGTAARFPMFPDLDHRSLDQAIWF